MEDRLFLKKISDTYVLHRISNNVLTIEGDSHYTIGGIEPLYKLSLKNCQAIERGYDLDELAKQEYKYNNDMSNIEECFVDRKRQGFIKGFQKALEILGDKKFSEDDAKRLFELGVEHGHRDGYIGLNYTNECIQSLQQNEWDVSFNPDEKDSEGCLILKRL